MDKKIVCDQRSFSMDSVTVVLLVRYGPGCGLRKHIKDEVVHLSLQFATEDFGSCVCGNGVVESSDPTQPHFYHQSRLLGLRMAEARRPEIEALGFGGPAVVLRIPGIPFEQQQDGGLHMSLYNQPQGDDVSYTPPDKEVCSSLQGKRFVIQMSGALKILNGSEGNDVKVGGCYYVSLGCGHDTTQLANEIKTQVGLTPDESQRFHLSLATIAPAWLKYHPKSLVASETKSSADICKDAMKIFRHGDAKFVGFNDDETTGWTKHNARVIEIARANAVIQQKLEELPALHEDREKLKMQIVDVRTLGFCRAVGLSEQIPKICRHLAPGQKCDYMPPNLYADDAKLQDQRQ